MGKRLVFGKRSYAVIAAALLYLAPTPFARYHVRYKIVETSSNPPALAYMTKRFGNTSVPWTVVDGVAVAGYNEPRFKQLLCLK